MNTQPLKTKTNKCTRRLRYITNITKIDKHKKLNSTSTREHKTERNYALVNQTMNIRKSNKGATKEIEHISNNNTKSIRQFLNS